MQPQLVGDFAQHQWAHRDFTVIKKMTLAFDDGLRDAFNRIEALLYVFEQPFGFLQLREQAAAIGRA